MTVEYAQGPRRSGDFPSHWGSPEGTGEERTAWILRNIGTGSSSGEA